MTFTSPWMELPPSRHELTLVQVLETLGSHQTIVQRQIDLRIIYDVFEPSNKV